MTEAATIWHSRGQICQAILQNSQLMQVAEELANMSRIIQEVSKTCE